MKLSLLEETRKINGLLQRAGEEKVDFDEIASLLSTSIDSIVFILSRKGKILGSELKDDFLCDILFDDMDSASSLNGDFNELLLNIYETEANMSQESGKCFFFSQRECTASECLLSIIPVISGGERLSTIVVTKSEALDNQDLILSEYCSAVVGMEILRARGEDAEKKARKKAETQVAVGALTHSELEAVKQLLLRLDGDEGLLVAGEVADDIGISRSVIVNALNKFESAGVIQSRSLGMKGTHIKVLNNALYDEIDSF